jgi:Fungalysin/Thermolysin Propeptide Motif
VRLSPDSRRIESVVGFGTRSYGEKPELAARSFLTENASLFGLKPDLGDLRVLSTIQTKSSGHVEFQQILNGLPVENARIRVNLSKDGRVLEVKNSYQPFAVAPATPRITREQAVETAIQELLNPKDKPTPGKPERANRPPPPAPLSREQLQLSSDPLVNDEYFVTGGGNPRRAYKVLIRAKVPLAIREVIVDADNGQILRSRSLINYFDDGTGQVFVPNPVNSLNNNGLTDSNYTTQPNTSRNPNPYYTRTLLDLDPPVGGKYKLTGPFVTLEEIEDPKHAPPTESTSTFVYQRGDANFDDVMVYYHIDSMERYIQLLGFININNRRVRVDSDGVPTSDPGCGTPDANGECDQSHYSPDV